MTTNHNHSLNAFSIFILIFFKSHLDTKTSSLYFAKSWSEASMSPQQTRALNNSRGQSRTKSLLQLCKGSWSHFTHYYRSEQKNWWRMLYASCCYIFLQLSLSRQGCNTHCSFANPHEKKTTLFHCLRLKCKTLCTHYRDYHHDKKTTLVHMASCIPVDKIKGSWIWKKQRWWEEFASSAKRILHAKRVSSEVPILESTTFPISFFTCFTIVLVYIRMGWRIGYQWAVLMGCYFDKKGTSTERLNE